MASTNSKRDELLDDMPLEEEYHKLNASSKPLLLFPPKDRSDAFRYKGEKKPFPFGIDVKQPRQPQPKSSETSTVSANAPQPQDIRPRTSSDCNYNYNCSYNRGRLICPQRSVENMAKYLASPNQRRRFGLSHRSKTEKSHLAIQEILGIAPIPNAQANKTRYQNESRQDGGCEPREGESLQNILTSIWCILVFIWNCWQEVLRPAAETVPDHPAQPEKEVINHTDGPEPGVLDTVFVSLDLKYLDSDREQERKCIAEVGVSTFDTRAIIHRIARAKNVISTKHFKLPHQSRAFNFGQSELTTAAWIPQYLRRLFYPNNDPDSEWKDRKLVLVGHGIAAKISLLKNMGISLYLSEAIVRVVDTKFLVREIMGPHIDSRLSAVVRECGMRGVNFNNAGNDANYTLRSMLLLALKNCEIGQLTKSQEERVGFYRKMCAD